MSNFRQYSTPSTSSPAQVNYQSSALASLRLKWRLQYHSLDETYLCKWEMCRWDGGYVVHCDALFCGDNLSDHLREAHNIHGADKLRVYCLWDGCGSEMNKESLVRHVEERHLGVSHRCNTCGVKRFSRRDTLIKHMKTCPGP
jgi:hypothetical protein